MRDMEEKIDIFISYSHRDSGIAKNLVSKLEEAGLRCFIAEKDIAAGELWESRIKKAIINAKRVFLLITPRSKNSLWVATEAGAAWALEKELIAGLMFVESNELIDVIRRHQARRVESQEEVQALVNELAPKTVTVSSKLTGQWVDPIDGDTVYFRQMGDRAVGFYDYGSGNRKVGIYRGVLDNSVFEYHWKWLERDLSGKGRMVVATKNIVRIDSVDFFAAVVVRSRHENYRCSSRKLIAQCVMPPTVHNDDVSRRLLEIVQPFQALAAAPVAIPGYPSPVKDACASDDNSQNSWPRFVSNDARSVR